MRLFELGGLGPATQSAARHGVPPPARPGDQDRARRAARRARPWRRRVSRTDRRRRVLVPDPPRRPDAGVLHGARQGDARIRRSGRRPGDGPTLPRRTAVHDHRALCVAGGPQQVRTSAWRGDVNEAYDGLVCVAVPIRTWAVHRRRVGDRSGAAHGLGRHDRRGEVHRDQHLERPLRFVGLRPPQRRRVPSSRRRGPLTPPAPSTPPADARVDPPDGPPSLCGERTAHPLSIAEGPLPHRNVIRSHLDRRDTALAPWASSGMLVLWNRRNVRRP